MLKNNEKREKRTVHVRETESQMAMRNERELDDEEGYAERRPQSLRHFSIADNDPETLRKHHELIEKLLAEFDLEESKVKYRSVPVELRSTDKAYSYDCEMAGMHVRRRLEHLMGTDVVKLNDKAYISTLQQRLQEEYEASLVRREQTLENNEKLRLRKLYLEGVIPRPPGETDFMEKKKGGKKEKKKLKVKVQEGPDKETGIWPKTGEIKAKESPRESKSSKVCVSMMPEDEEHYRRAGKQTTSDGTRQRLEDMPEVVEWYENNDRAMPRYYDEDGNPLPVRYEAPVVGELRQEETVQGLYTVANKIIA